MRRRKLNKTILFILIFCISIGFAYLSTQLNINGGASVRGNTWDIHFENVQVVESVEGNSTPTISSDKKSVDYVANLNEPGDVFSFNVDVVNAGTLDGMIESITNDGLTAEQQKLVNVEYKYANGDPFEEHFVILNGNRKTINVRVEYKYDIEEEDLPTELTSINLTFSITYQQATEDSYTSATFKTGPEISSKMIALSSSPVVGYSDYNGRSVTPSFLNNIPTDSRIFNLSDGGSGSTVKSFLKSSEMIDGLSSLNIVSTDYSDVPIYMWFVEDDSDINHRGTIYWYSDADVVFFNSDSSSFFNYAGSSNYCYFSNLINVDGLYNINGSKVTTLEGFFIQCSSLQDISSLENLDTSHVTNINSLFLGCSALSNIDFLSNWNIESVSSLSEVFSGCTSLTDVDSLSTWNTQNITYVYSLFSNCQNLVNISGVKFWNLDNVKEMTYIFNGCSSLNDITPLSDWDTSSFTDITGLFSGCSSLTDVNSLSLWDVSNVTNMFVLFEGCSSLNDITGLSNWNVSKIDSTYAMFKDCTSLVDISPLANWDVSNVTRMHYMFFNCSSLTDATCLENWDVSNVTNKRSMFSVTNVTSESAPSWY